MVVLYCLSKVLAITCLISGVFDVLEEVFSEIQEGIISIIELIVVDGVRLLHKLAFF